MPIKKTLSAGFLTPALIISMLGYFVDTFDIVIFSIVRVSSLSELGYTGDALTQKGIFLLNMQLAGMLLGGVFWGFLGDRRGRSSALVFSILCYALANIANGFVDTIEAYAICRFVSGIGLAGELGAAVTLIMEGLPQKKRGFGALIITFIGSLGALTAAAFGSLLYWRHLYFLGGAMGLVLLLGRSKVKESDMFLESKTKTAVRGSFLEFFKSRRMFGQFMACFMIGIPHYFCFGVLVTLAPEIAVGMGFEGKISVPALLTIYAAFLSLGDMSATLLSQYLKSRKKAVIAFLLVASTSLIAFYAWAPLSPLAFYTIFGFLGFFAGYVLMVPMIAAEMFGINLRVTASSTITNCVRASAIVMNLGVAQLKYMGILTATQIVGFAVMSLALLAAFALRETFHKDMNFLD